MTLRALGHLAAWRDGEPVTLGPVRQRAVLGILAVSPDLQASREAISEALWPDEPPPTATAMIHSYVSRLRRALDPQWGSRTPGGLVTATANGYRLLADRCTIDVVEFARLARDARAAMARRDAARACELYARALALWQGEPLGDLDLLRSHPAVAGLARQRATAVVEFADVAVTHGWPDRALAHLQDLAERDPLNERACAWLMLALAGCGQQAAALAAYGEMRHRLDDQLGIQPGAELTSTYQRVLRQQLPVAETASGRAPGVRQPPVSEQQRPTARALSLGCQLPAAIADFTGRAIQMAELTRVLTAEQAGVGVPVAVISGLPGVGKTSLALQAAHTVRASFPDGQLWIPLDGTSARPREPAEVLGELLRMLGVHGSALPDSTGERAALYRSRLAGCRVLVVADDAATTAQVEPLLPGTSGSAVVITSRSPAVAPSRAWACPLGPLSPAEAADLLGRIVGQARVAVERQAAAELTNACGMLPLAVRIAGAKLAARPAWPLSVLARKLSSQLRRLDEFQIGNLSVRASVTSSYEALDERARRAFRLLGLLGPLEVAEWVIGALLGEAEAPDVVTGLSDKSLLSPAGVDATGQPRYRLHDLLRAYAAEQLAGEPEHSRERALHQVLSGWLQLASLAGSRLPPEPFFPRENDALVPGPVPPPAADSLTADPVAWFAAERLNLLAVCELTCSSGNYRLAGRLARALAGFHYLHSRHEDAQSMWAVVLAAAQKAGDQPTATHARLRLAAVTCGRGHHAEAAPAVERCAAELAQRGDLRLLTTALYWRAVCASNLGAFEDTRHHACQATEIAHRTSDRHGELMALRMLGMAQANLPGHEDHAILNCQRAVALAQEHGDPLCEREMLHTLAHVCNRTQRHARAIRICMQGLALDKGLGYPAGEGPWLGVLGDAYHGLGRYQEAAETFSRALTIFEHNFMRRHQALCLLKLGYAHQAAGDQALALSYLEQSLPIFRDLRLPHYERRARQMIVFCQNGQFCDLSNRPPTAIPLAKDPA